MPADTIPHRFMKQAEQRPDVNAYYVREDGKWLPTTWATYVSEVRQAARAMITLGLQPGQSVCILGFNRPEWTIFDFAAMAAGGVPAGIYTTCSADEVRYIIDHAEAGIVLLEDASQWAKVKSERDAGRLPKLEHVVMMKGTRIEDPMVLTWDAFMAKGDATEASALEDRLAKLDPQAVATLIYTSGTTGPPKGVMLTHENLAWTASTAVDMVGMNEDGRMVSYLPLSHIAEQMFTLHGPASSGYAIYFAESLERLLDNMQEARPTLLFAVPRVWEKMHAKVSSAVKDATGVKAKLLHWSMGVGREVCDVRNAGGTPTGLLALKYKIAKKLIFSKLKPKLGLDAARFGISGAAPIAKEILEFFAGLDIVIHEVYGQSEGSGPTTFNRPGLTRYGTVGPAIPGCEVRIADDGEICLRGPNVFKGYFKDPAATADTLIDGWLHSGDLGTIDDQGFLSITGRKKDIIITAGGKNIAPANIESALKNLPLVSQAVVIGDRRKFLSALVALDPEAAEAWAKEHGVPAESLHSNPEVIAEIQKGIDSEVNPLFARVEHIRKFKVLHRELSVDEGELTPTLKVKRRIVDENFASEIEAIYADA